MDSAVTFSVVLDRPLHQRLCRAAKQLERSPAWVIDEALRAWLAAREDAPPPPDDA